MSSGSTTESSRGGGYSTVDANDFKEMVRSRTHLVDLVGESVALKPLRGGSDFVGLCPFHDDHSPSFHVYPDRQSWRCWVCQEGGDCFSFVMKKDGLGFRDTLEFLALRANLELPKQLLRGSREDRDSRLKLYEVLTWARGEFRRCLLQDVQAGPARDYLDDRGFTPEILERFEVGYHPDDWHWLINRSRGKFAVEQLLKVKLAGEKESTGSRYDYFRDRVIFPIADERGRAIAFGGRILPGSDDPTGAKYWNSPESPLFSKSRTLYGFHLAKEAVRTSGIAVVTEGYTDCMMAHQHGLENVVGTLGTALTEHHVSMLKRFARTVVLIYDGDNAGRMAAERSVVQFLAQELDLRILTLPKKMDLADFLFEEGADALRGRIGTAPEAWDYKLRAVIERVGLETVDARQQIAEELLDLIVQVPRLSGGTRESMILAQIARRLGVEERVLRQDLAERAKKSRQTGRQQRTTVRNAPVDPSGFPPTTSSETTPQENGFVDDPSRENHRSANPSPTPTVFGKYDRLECELLEILLTDPKLITTVRREIGPDDLTHLGLRDLLGFCFDLDDEGLVPSYERLTSTVEDLSLKSLLAWLDEDARRKGTDRLLRGEGEFRQAVRSKAAMPKGNANPDLNPTLNMEPDSCPAHLRDTLKNLQWRREELQQERRRGQFAALQPGGSPNTSPDGSGDPNGIDRSSPPSSPPNAFDEQTRKLLAEAADFHRQRATRTTHPPPGG